MPFGGIIGFLFFLVIMGFMQWKPEGEELRGLKKTAALCIQIGDCADYPRLRDVCATAGSFEKCMEVKYGSSETYDDAKMLCTNDGKVKMDPDKLPGFFECAVARWKAD